MTAPLDWLKTPITAVRDAVDDFKKWTAFVEALHEAEDGGASLLDRLRLCGGDIRALESAPPAESALLYRLMETLGIDARAIEAGIRRELEQTCGCCAHKAECRSDLDTGESAARWTAYCDNRQVLAGLMAGETAGATLGEPPAA